MGASEAPQQNGAAVTMNTMIQAMEVEGLTYGVQLGHRS